MTLVKVFPTSSLLFSADPSFHRWAQEPAPQGHAVEITPHDIFIGDLKQAGYFLRTNQYNQLSNFFAERGIARTPHALWQFAAAFDSGIAPLNENMVWRTLSYWTQKLTSALIESDYLRDGRIRKIGSAEEGIALVTVICRNLPDDWDFLDALAYLHEQFKTDPRYQENQFDFFGPWDPKGMKFINATFRSWAIFMERYSGTLQERKFQALFHPITDDRAQHVRAPYSLLIESRNHLHKGSLSAAETFQESARSIMKAHREEYFLTIPRLRVETFVISWFLEQSPLWFGRLVSQKEPAALLIERKERLQENRKMQEALRMISEYLTAFQKP